MFKQARLRLTGWYLLIIMLVSLAFTSVIYRASTFELNRFAVAQQSRFEKKFVMVNDNVVQFQPGTPPMIDEGLIEEAKSRILRSLVLINLGIMSISFILGYYLSGKTLSPIQEMMDEQYRFISDASHELKTPITAIKSTLEVALRDPKMGLAEAKQTLNTGLEEVNQLQKLAEGLLELSSDHHEPMFTAIDLRKVSNEAIKLIEPVALNRKIEIVTSLAKVNIMGESESLKRAIVIILDNAIKYSKAKSKVHVSLKTSGKTATLKVRDTGDGISETDLPQIFNRFYRSDKARTTDGHGLGLAIAKKIVEAQSGEIKIESKKDKGTTVNLIFPYSARIQN